MSKSVHCLLALSLTAVPVAGCTSVNRFDKQQLERLDGYEYQYKSMSDELMEGVGAQQSDDPQLLLEDGGVYDFDGEDPLVLFLPGPEPDEPRQIEHLYVAMEVSQENFAGEPRSGETVTVPRSDIQAAGVRQFSWPKTLLLSGGIAAVLVGGLFTVALLTDGGGGDGDGGSWD